MPSARMSARVWALVTIAQVSSAPAGVRFAFADSTWAYTVTQSGSVGHPSA
jgi:hypothetical protein